MRKVLAFIIALSLPCVVFAAVEVREEGTRLGSVEYVDFVGSQVTATKSGSLATVTIADSGTATTSAVTNETLTAAVDGKLLLYTAGGEKELPISTSFSRPIEFVAGSDDTLSIDPYSTDIIAYGDGALDAGDKISSSGTTGDSVKLIPTATGWTASFHGDQWSDGGA